jgi:hypothetical protein
LSSSKSILFFQRKIIIFLANCRHSLINKENWNLQDTHANVLLFLHQRTFHIIKVDLIYHLMLYFTIYTSFTSFTSFASFTSLTSLTSFTNFASFTSFTSYRSLKRPKIELRWALLNVITDNIINRVLWSSWSRLTSLISLF